MNETAAPGLRNNADYIDNSAAIYIAIGRYARAEELYKIALRRAGKAAGIEIANALRKLINAYFYQNRYDDAEPLYKEARKER